MKEAIVMIVPDPNGDSYTIRHNRIGQLSTIWVNGRMAMNVEHYDVLLDNDRTVIRLLLHRGDEDRQTFDGLKRQSDGALLGKVAVEFDVECCPFELSSKHFVVNVGAKGMTDSTFPPDWPWPNANLLRITSNLRGIQRVEIGLVPDNSSPRCTDEDRKQGCNLPILNGVPIQEI